MPRFRTPQVRANKYNARRTQYLGEWYPSAAEANYAAILELRRRAGEIESWARGSVYTLIDGPTREMRITFRPDFVVRNLDGSLEAVDVKGVVTKDFRLRAILWAHACPKIPLRVVNGDGNVVWPKRGRG